MSQKVWDRLSLELKAPEEYCVSNAEKAKKLKELIKAVFELASVHPARGTGPLKSLLVDGIDEETLWEQIQTRNNPLLKYLRKYMKSVSKRPLEFLPAEESDEEEEDATSADISDEEEEEDQQDEMDEEEEESDDEEEMDEDDDEQEDDDEEDDDDDEEEVSSDDNENEIPQKSVTKNSKKRVHGESTEGWDTDEELAMEAWLDATDELDNKHLEKLEKKEKRAKANTMDQWDDEEDDDEDDMDIVEKAMYGSDEDEDEDDDGLDPSTMRYEDFYVDDAPSKKNASSAAANKKRKVVDIDDSSDEEEEDFDMDNEEDDYEESEEEDDYGRPRNNNSSKYNNKTNQKQTQQQKQKDKPVEFATIHQRRLQELSTQIQELEQELIAEKSWEMRGEVGAQHRPENSLLDMAVDVDRATKVAPVITQEYTSTLEDLILRRIEDGKFDDPKPRNAMAEVLTAEPGDDKDPIELSQEKSKLGLAEIYAEDFAKKMLNSDEKLSVETQALREEVVGLFGAVSRHLDALCHFYFTPRPVAGETSAKVLATQRAMPALELEDVAPFTVQSEASKMAPEELLAKKKGPRIMLLTSEEMGRDDRKKRRRVQKELSRGEKRRAEAQLDDDVKRARREEAALSRDKRVSVHNGGSGKSSNSQRKSTETGEFSKSSKFFSNLQKDVEANVKSNKQQLNQPRAGKNGSGKEVSSSSYKL